MIGLYVQAGTKKWARWDDEIFIGLPEDVVLLWEMQFGEESWLLWYEGLFFKLQWSC